MSSDTEQANASMYQGDGQKRAAQTVASRKREYGIDASFNNETPASTPEKPRRDDRRYNSKDEGYSSEESAARSGKRSASKHNVLSRSKKAMTEIKLFNKGEEESKIHEIENQCKAKFLYKPFIPLPNLSEYLGCIIKVVIESDYLTNENPTIIKRHIWGNDFYSSDSDIVCVSSNTSA